jgi:hypothetical protein
MTDPERIGHLLTELGRESDAEEVTEYDGTTWSIVFDANTLVVIELDATQNVLTLSLDLGKPDSDRRNETYQTALISNYVSPQGDVVRIALDGVDGNLVLMQSVAASNLDVETLRKSLLQLREQARPWRDLLVRGGVSTEARDTSETVLESLTGLRV